MTRDYCGNYIYRNGAIERIMMGNGFLQDSVYYVQVKDYQGNVRAVLDQNHNVVERNTTPTAVSSMPATRSSSLTSTAQKNSTARTALIYMIFNYQ